MVDRTEIGRAILRYLLKHPDAGDTLEGIMTWWIREELLAMRIEDVGEVVRQLCSKGILLEKQIAGSGKLYLVNRAKLEVISKLIEEPGG